MANEFWILVAVTLISCGILFFIDRSGSKQSTLITLYIVLAAALIFAVWGINAIPVIIIKGAAVVAGAYFGRYFIRRIAARKV